MASPGPAVFVYGTLMPGESRWPALEVFAAQWEPAIASGALYDTGNGYPAAIFGAEAGTIPGVRVELRGDNVAEAIARLDRIEAEGTLYRRVTIRTSEGDATSYEWIGPTSTLRRLERGWSAEPG